MFAPRDKRHALGPILLLPVFAGATFLAGIAWEGKGDLPIVQGLSQVSSYDVQSSLARNLYALARNDESTALVAALTCAAWIGMYQLGRRRGWVGEPWLEFTGLLLISAAATLIQFRWRAYYHYALLAIPCLVISAVVLSMRTYQLFPERVQRNGLFPWILLGCAAFPLAYTGGSLTSLSVWRVTLEPDFAPAHVWRRQVDVQSDLRELRQWLHPGDELIVLPIRQNCIHFTLGTRVIHFPNGYNWDPQPEMLNETLRCGIVSSVLLVTKPEVPDDDANWGVFQTKHAPAQLDRLGFRPAHELRTMTLWRRRE
jgi:hypothetical protein